MHRRLALAADKLVAHLASLGEQPAAFLGDGSAVARDLREPLPEAGSDFGPLLDLVVDRLAPLSFNCAGPGYLAYIPGGGLFDSALAALLADGLNRYVGVWMAAPGFAELEANVIRWLAAIVGYPATARGYLSSGGSLANFTALYTARCEKLGERFSDGILYASDQVHHSVAKAASLVGFPAANVRAVASDQHYRLRAAAVATAIAEDRRAGRRPFLIVASAGTTNTGAVDELAALADLAAREGLWLHVDAAYGGFFAMTERGRSAMRGLDRADSITLDPHKGLFLPYGVGCLLVRDGAALARAHGASAGYMRNLQAAGEEEWTDFCQISPELSRGFRGLKVWLPLKLHGAGAFRRELDEKLDLTRWLTAELAGLPGVEIVAPPQLSILAFRLRVAGLDGAALDALNQAFLDRINARQRVFLSGTLLPAGFVLRVCVLSFRTHRERLEAGLEDIRLAAAETLAGVSIT